MADHEVEVAVIGAGMSGLHIAHRFRESGVPFTVYEKADDVGGTWRENVYPGLFVDVPTSKYQLAFAPKYDWSRPFAPGPEIQAYLCDVADRFDLRRHIEFGVTVTAADWEGDGWRLATADGRTIRAAIVVFATGFLHHPTLPALAGMDEFAGPSFHTSRWPRDLSVAGQRVGIVGSGSSGIQLVTELAEHDCHVTQFVRTPQWIETVDNPESAAEHRRQARADPGTGRELLVELEKGINQDPRLADPYWKLMPGELRASAVQALREDLLAIRDPLLRAALTPDFPPGCKRIPKSHGYYRAVQEPNVRIVRAGVARVDPSGVTDTAGDHHDLDVLVYATGFQAHAYMRPVRVRGENGLSLDSVWADGPFAYRGVAVPGFPNMFLLHGPFSPVNNVPVPTTLEDEVGWISRVVDVIRTRRVAAAPTAAATDRFRRTLAEAIPQTVWADGCDNWYKGRGTTAVIWPWYEKEHKMLFEDPIGDELRTTPLRPAVAADPANVAELLDRAAILDVYARYALAMDQGDHDLFETVWSADAVWMCAALGLNLKGRNDIMAHFDRKYANAPVLPAAGGQLRLAGNHLIDVRGDQATVRAELAAFRYTGDALHMYTAGYYDDRFVRTSDGWRVSYRDMVVTPVIPAP